VNAFSTCENIVDVSVSDGTFEMSVRQNTERTCLPRIKVVEWFSNQIFPHHMCFMSIPLFQCC
jgi:hypothetical protein